MSQLIEVKIPDIGDFKDVPVIEVQVKAGDSVKAEDALLTLETDKATMDVPSPAAGVVKEVKIKVGDKVAEGTLIVLLETGADSPAATQSPAAQSATIPPPVVSSVPSPPAPAPAPAKPPAVVASIADIVSGGKPHASPSVRRFARELGADLTLIRGSGAKGRILKEDVQTYIKGELTKPRGGAAAPAAGGGLNLLPWPQVDFAKFGPVESQPLSRLKKLSAANLARNWVMIPHVTQFDEADITELEAFRKSIAAETEKQGAKLTMLAFMIKACVGALKKFPDFNASLDGENLILKHYYHIGFAADTPNGLMVPVVRDADQKGITDIARETALLAAAARDGKLKIGDMQGGTFSISSLGGIGGSAFTPIINAPEVAILGVSKSQMKQAWDGEKFVPRLMLPLSLSYDHRVIDGAAAARFTGYLAQLLADMRRVLM